jgi:hypothetical protein
MEEENCSLTPDGFARILEEKRDKDLIVLDVRSFANFSQSHLRSSIHVCLPSSLVKRKSFSLTNVESTISCDTSREKLKKRQGADVVLYDSDCEKVKKNCVLSSLIQKFKEEQQVNSVSFLLGNKNIKKLNDICDIQKKFFFLRWLSKFLSKVSSVLY